MVTQRDIALSYFYTFSTLCGKFVFFLFSALHTMFSETAAITVLYRSHKHSFYPEITQSIRFEIVWSVRFCSFRTP